MSKFTRQTRQIRYSNPRNTSKGDCSGRKTEHGPSIRDINTHVLVSGSANFTAPLCFAYISRRAHGFVVSGKPFTGLLSNIARTLASDLRLDGPDVDYLSSVLTTPAPGAHDSLATGGSTVVLRTREEFRALLACYIMSSS
jgi:hypothetical protein